MKQSVMLTITSLLSILFMTFHLADDTLFEIASPRFANLFAVLVFVIWLYGTLVLAERRAGYIIILRGGRHGVANGYCRRKNIRRLRDANRAVSRADAALTGSSDGQLDKKRPSR
jgi:hypothetical protein